jgi:Sulfotransferase family
MYQGANLVFLVSQPRVGSTMLQRILGAHSDLHTMSEPWLMFRPLIALRDDDPGGHSQPAWMARRGLRDFLGGLPGQEDDYREGVRRMYGFLYEQALLESRKRYFVDKTPWYSLILPELALTFSEARFLILYRNPLAAFVSFVDTWFSIIWKWIDEFRPCILDFPRLLVQGKNLLRERGFVVSYEQLVREPAPVVQGICNWLDIEFRPEMLEYGNASLPVFARGDPDRVYQHVRPTTEYVDAWQRRLADPQMWRWISEYLDFLGPEVLKQMGYSYADLRSLTDSRRPAGLWRATTISLETLFSGRAQRRVRAALAAIRWRAAFWKYGVIGSAAEFSRRAGRRMFGASNASAPESSGMSSVASPTDKA